MRALACLSFVIALAGCTTETIDAGTNDGGTKEGAATGPGAGGDGGPMVIASLIQLAPTILVSDGTTLFWVDSVSEKVSSMPVGGGPISTPVSDAGGSSFLFVDGVNVYYWGAGGIYRAPKDGSGSTTLVNEATDAGTTFGPITTLGGSAYWLEDPKSDPNAPDAPNLVSVRTAPLQGGPVTTIAQFDDPVQITAVAATTTTFFLQGIGGQFDFFPLSSGLPDGGPLTPVPGFAQPAVSMCWQMFSDKDAVYCLVHPDILRVANDGTTTSLGTQLNPNLVGGFAIDDQYVYWVESFTVGTIMRVPKTGGTASIIARDTKPIAIAVDANAVYWSDDGGNIMRLDKAGL